MIDEGRLRLFAALQLPERYREAFTRLQVQLQRAAPADLKWVPSELMHLTLLFLGSQPQASLGTIEDALDAAASTSASFLVGPGHLGSFGHPGRLQAIWVGLEAETPALQELHRAISGHLLSEGIPFDPKPLVPHVTLARSRRGMERAASLHLHAALGALKPPTLPPFVAEEFALMESRLSQAGPEYRVARKFRLGI